MRTVPKSGSRNRANIVARVDLPDPDGPTRAVTVPGRSVKETWLRAGTSPSGVW